jgi:predicted dithiol-disulfide oxidoreductase (DUF899 family)
MMSLPDVVSRPEWLAARKALLAQEKAQKREIDQLNADRRRLPMVAVTKDYQFEGPAGPASLLDMFEGQRQLVLQHFMFDPSWDDGCPSCSAGVDEMSDGLLAHLRARDTAFSVVGRAPIAKIEAYKKRKGWTVPFYSSHGSDFNYDFHVTIDASVTPVEFNFRDTAELAATSLDWLIKPENQPSEQPGVSFFLRDGSDIFHTYSTFARGTEALGGAYSILDLTALGRQEEWEEPKGRSAAAHAAIPDFSS